MIPGETSNTVLTLLGWTLVTALLLYARTYNYLLFHSASEAFSVVIAGSIFILAWNSRQYADNQYLIFLGISFLFIGLLNGLHTLAYKGMGIFPGYGANLPTQLWIAAMFLQSFSLLLAPLFIKRRVPLAPVFLGYALVTVFFLGTIFIWPVFPDCFLEPGGLTGFKVACEYGIMSILFAALVFLRRQRQAFEPDVFRLISWAIAVMIATELCFTLYQGVYDISNLSGHLLKIVAFYLIYRGLIITGITRPQGLLFRNLQERSAELARAVSDLEETNSEIERFLYTISHDLKSPLVTISTFLGYLDKDLQNNDAARVDKDIRYIRSAADKMANLLNELLEMSRLGRVINPATKATFQELVREALEAVRGAIVLRGVEVQVKGSDVTLCGDRPRLVEIWQNLVENAVKYLGEQPLPRLDLGLERQGEGIIFFVQDNGIGIEPRYHDKIFGIFEKLEPNSGGTGIGLAIVKRIVELNNGKIWVESAGLGQGACFKFTLPEAVAGRRQRSEGEKDRKNYMVPQAPALKVD